MLEQTKRISFRISSVLSKVEQVHWCSMCECPAPAPTKKYRLRNTGLPYSSADFNAFAFSPLN